jgi:predicted transcriptional regulator YheO
MGLAHDNGAGTPVSDELRGLTAEVINAVLEQLVAPLQAALPKPTEVVLHDLRRIPHSVRAIAGNVTGRRVGDPPTDKLLARLATGTLDSEIGYRSELPDGRILQSATIIYVADDGAPAAALCVNNDVSAWVSLRCALDRFVLGDHAATITVAPARACDAVGSVTDAAGGYTGESFPHSVEELAARMVESAIASVGVPVDKMRKEHKMGVVAKLDRRGFFLVKQAAETVAAALGVTRFTIYNYLNEANDGA